MKYLFEEWEIVQERIRRAQTLFLLLDYDGTLTPIAARPEQALCSPEVRVLLEKLRDCPKVLLAIISGRSLEDIHAKVGVSGIIYVGNYGLEIENPAGIHRKRLSPAREKELGKIRQNLEERLRPIAGIFLEDKGPVLAVHYRNAPAGYSLQVQRIVKEILREWEDHWQTISGKKIIEIQPHMDFNKGKTVQELLNGAPFPGLLSIYLGDDRSDEDAFQALPDQGISILVGPGSTPSAADYFLPDPSEVQDFLKRCLEILRSRRRE